VSLVMRNASRAASANDSLRGPDPVLVEPTVEIPRAGSGPSQRAVRGLRCGDRCLPGQAGRHSVVTRVTCEWATQSSRLSKVILVILPATRWTLGTPPVKSAGPHREASREHRGGPRISGSRSSPSPSTVGSSPGAAVARVNWKSFG